MLSLKDFYWRLLALAGRAFEADAANVERCLRRFAAEETARYLVETGIPLHTAARDRYALMDRALRDLPAGLVLEFGVWKGASVRRIARRLPGRAVFGFDSFEGLAEPWIFSGAGAFGDVGPRLPKVPPNVALVKGYFQQTLPGFLAKQQEAAALVHIDSDLYSSCRYVLSALTPRIRPGTILVFDEFFNYPGWQQGERQAFDEWQAETGVRTEVVGFCVRPGVDWSGHQLALRVTGIAPNP